MSQRSYSYGEVNVEDDSTGEVDVMEHGSAVMSVCLGNIY